MALVRGLIHMVFWGSLLAVLLFGDYELKRDIGAQILFIMMPTYLGAIFGENRGRHSTLGGALLLGGCMLAYYAFFGDTLIEKISAFGAWFYSYWYVLAYRLPKIRQNERNDIAQKP